VTDSVVDLATHCTVALYRGDDFLGSGFFVAPGQVLTCAHVVAGCGEKPVTVRWAGAELDEIDARSRCLIPRQSGAGPTYAFPDLALIAVNAPPGQPYVWLADQEPAVASDIACFGFSGQTPAAGIAPDSALLKVASAGGRQLVRVQQGEIPAGMSGSLALDLDSQRVCGVVKASRDTAAARGGWIIPISAIAVNLGEIVRQNAAGHGPTSSWRQAATRYVDCARLLFGTRSPLRVPAPPRDAPPSWWLDPRHQATRFQERPELADLLAWAVNENPETPVARLVTGEGGSGKTRLAVELTARLAATGWIAGLLTADDFGRLPEIAKELPKVLAYQHRVFIAIDYPEGLGDSLTEFLGRLPGAEHGIVRILLLARFGGRWWTSLHPSTEINYLIDREPIRLGPLGSAPDQAAARFTEAVQDYRLRILGPPGTEQDNEAAVPAGLAATARSHHTAINLHALALASVLHERDHGVLPAGDAAWTDPLTMLVAHERKHWRKAVSGRLSRTYSEELDGRILLVPTLLPVHRDTDAVAAISRVPGLTSHYADDLPGLAALLRDLYPPAETSLRWWSPLPLDRLGETLLAEVLTDSLNAQSADDYIMAMFDQVDLPQAVPGLTLVTRLNADAGRSAITAERTRSCLDQLATAAGRRLLPALMLADRQVTPDQRASERYLASLSAPDALTLAQNVERIHGQPRLHEVGLVLLDHAQRFIDSDEFKLNALPEELRGILPILRARGIEPPMETRAHVHAKVLRVQLLLRLSRAGEAVELAKDVARAARAIARTSGAEAGGARVVAGDESITFATQASDERELLLYTLDVYADALHGVGRLQESAAVRRECATVADEMAKSAEPGINVTRAAAMHWAKLAEILLELDQGDQAEACARRVVHFARALSDLPRTAEALTLWAQSLDQAGRTAKARGVAVEALRLHRDSADQTGDRAHLAVAMQALAHLMPQSADRADPLAGLRAEAQRDPATGLLALFAPMTQHARRLLRQGQAEEARRLMAEAVTRARQLADYDPANYVEVLAVALMASVNLGLSADPVAAIREAVDTYRRLVDQHDGFHPRTGLALALQELSLAVRRAGRDREALRGFAEAVELLRPLMAQDRWGTAVHLSVNLGLLSETARVHGDPEQAVAAVREAIDLELARSDDLKPSPTERLPELRHMLFLALAKILGKQEAEEADPALILATLTEICAAAYSVPPDKLGADGIRAFAGALAAVGASFQQSGQLEQAQASFGDAVKVLRDHADSDPVGESTRLLLTMGAARVAVYRELGRHADTVLAMMEALADCRRPPHGPLKERLDCLLLAGDVIDCLPRPAFAADGLQLAVAMSQTCRELPPNLGESRGGAAALLLIHRFLKGLAGNGLLGDQREAAALEVSMCARFLAEHAPELLGREHAEALTLAAVILVDVRDLDLALDLNARAIELHQKLGADRDGPQRPDLLSLVQQGLILSWKHRYADAVPPLKSALAALLAAGPDISVEQAQLLNTVASALRDAYAALRDDAAMREMMRAIRESSVPDVVQGRPAAPEPGADLVSALQNAVQHAAADPGLGAAAIQQVLDNAAARKDYPVAHAASQYLVNALWKTGRLADALRAADLTIAYGHKANLNPWAQLHDKSERLQMRVQAGHDAQSILAEAVRLIEETDHLSPESPSPVDQDWVREALLRSAANAAGRLGQWPDMLRFTQAEVTSLRSREARPAEIADAEIGSYRALALTGRIPEAETLLDRCEAAFRAENDSPHLHLGLVTESRADLADMVGDLARAVELQCEALDELYQSGDVAQVRQAHNQLSGYLEKADRFSPSALAHVLAAGTLAVLLGQEADIRAIAGRMMSRAGEYPTTPAQLCLALHPAHGVHLSELLHQMTPNTTVSPGEILTRIIRQAHDQARAIFEEIARHRMEWDPVIAAMVAARQGEIAAARAVQLRLRTYANDRSWAQFSRALGYIHRQCPEAAVSLPLDIMDRILLRRCQDALDGSVSVPPELAQCVPIAGELSQLLQATQTGETSPALGRALDELAESRQWQQLATPLRKILAGDRDPGITTGLDPSSSVVITTLLTNLRPPA
jgi:tetratricopeptide (TPR) repeat protein